MTPEEALALAKTVSDVYSQATTRLVAAIARATAGGVDRPDWAVQSLAETLRLRAETQRIIAQLRTATRQEIPALLSRVYAAQAGGSINPRAVTALAEDTIRLLDDLNPRVLRWSEDVFRQVVAETLGPAVTGAVTRRDAAASVIDRLTRAGQTGFTDAAGRRWALDTYAEQATRTALGRAHLAGTLEQYREQGREWVIVSDSPEECPRCRPFEGKVLSLGADLPPPDLGGLSYAGTHSAAVAAGLHHPNCTHRVSAFVPGLTRPFDRDTENPEGYELRQRQRELERRVRDSKRRVEGITPLGDTAELGRQKRLLADRRRGLSEFITEHDRKAGVSRQRTNLNHR